MQDKTIGKVRPDGFPAGANDGDVEAAREAIEEETRKIFAFPPVEVIARQMTKLPYYEGLDNAVKRRTMISVVFEAIDRAGYVVKGKGGEAPLPYQKKGTGTCSENHNKAIRDASGNRVGMDRTQSFFYELMRDHLPPGKVEDIVRHVLEEDSEVRYCNGWLAEYAAYIVKRLWEKERDDETRGA